MDAVATIEPCEVDVCLGDVWYRVPALPAAVWLAAIIGEAGAVLPGLLPEDERADVYRRIRSGDLDVEEINTGWRDLLEAACGRTWWSAARLCKSAAEAEAWPVVHGKLLTQGVDLGKVSIGALCNAIFFMALSGAEDEAERMKLKFELEMPPAGVDVTPVDDEANTANFMDAIAQLQQFS